MKLSRRQLLVYGLSGGAALAGAGLVGLAPAGGVLADTGYAYGFLGEADRAVLAAVVPVLLAGAMPEAGREAGVLATVRGVDQAILYLPERTRAELRQLFDLLGGKLGRVVLAGVWADWPQADAKSVDAFLNDWRASYVELLRAAYAGLHDLTMAVWYGNPEAWPSIHYPGPPAIL